MFFNRITAIAIGIVICTAGSAQKKKDSRFKYGDITTADFAQSVYSIDSSADAVYLFDVGSSKYKNFGSFMNDIYKADRSKIVFIKKVN